MPNERAVCVVCGALVESNYLEDAPLPGGAGHYREHTVDEQVFRDLEPLS